MDTKPFARNQHQSCSNHSLQHSQESENAKLYIPHDLIHQILLRLPVKSLLRFKCVSRSWLSLISSKQFIRDHLNFNNVKTHLLIEGLYGEYRIYLKLCSVHSLLEGEEDLPNAPRLDFPFEEIYAPIYSSHVCHCNGLIFMVINHLHLHLWNPCTRVYKKLPDLGLKFRKCGLPIRQLREFGFGYDELNDDYKVVAGILDYLSDGCKSTIKVYSTKTKSWKRIVGFQGIMPPRDSGVYANGKLYWGSGLWDSRPIVSFDLATETFGEVDQPIVDNPYTNLGVLEGNLCWICDSFFSRSTEVWVLKENGNSRPSWTKMLSISHDIFDRYLTAAVSAKGEFLGLADGICVYNPKDHSIKHVNDSPDCLILGASYFSESLVDPGLE